MVNILNIVLMSKTNVARTLSRSFISVRYTWSRGSTNRKQDPKDIEKKLPCCSNGTQTSTSVWWNWLKTLLSQCSIWISSVLAVFSLAFLGLLIRGSLGGHVDGCCGHRDGAPAGHQVELHGFPCNESGRHLYLFGQAQVWTEAGHEVSGGDEVHTGLQRLQDQLEAPADLLLRDPRDGTDFCGGTETGWREETPTHFLYG